MGVALILEGIFSACYHICPNQSNYQFGKFVLEEGKSVSSIWCCFRHQFYVRHGRSGNGQVVSKQTSEHKCKCLCYFHSAGNGSFYGYVSVNYFLMSIRLILIIFCSCIFRFPTHLNMWKFPVFPTIVSSFTTITSFEVKSFSLYHFSFFYLSLFSQFYQAREMSPDFLFTFSSLIIHETLNLLPAITSTVIT